MTLFTGLFQHRSSRLITATALLSSVVLLSSPPPAQAGCGCDKAPPAPAQVRPHATYAGMDVTLFHPDLKGNKPYQVTFTSGITGQSETVSASIITQRDLADGQDKPQLVVTLPDLPLGPTSISVSGKGKNATLVSIDDTALTVVPHPLALSSQVGDTYIPDYQAAVSRDGTLYVSLDITGVTLPRTFHAQALGYPLRFSNLDVVFYNVQGFVMQLLEEGMTGLFAINAASGLNSDTLMYSRHEFNTYFLKHTERQAHEVDATDPNWHQNGTPHIDHDHLVVAIAGELADGSVPVPGATPAFDLFVQVSSLFGDGIVAESTVELSGNTKIDGFDSRYAAGTAARTLPNGQVKTNGLVKLSGHGNIKGDTTGTAFEVTEWGKIDGQLVVLPQPFDLLRMDLPADLENLGLVQLRKDEQLTLVGPASYQLAGLSLSNTAELIIDNAAGPVTLYVTGSVLVDSKSVITTLVPDPELFALYVLGSGSVELKNKAAFYGAVHAPDSLLWIDSMADFYGAFVGQDVLLTNGAKIYYDEALRSQSQDSGAASPSGTDSVAGTDTVQVSKATYRSQNGQLKIDAESSAAPDALLSVSIDGFVADAPMTYNASQGQYEYKITTDFNLDDQFVTVVSDLGGSVTTVIQ